MPPSAPKRRKLKIGDLVSVFGLVYRVHGVTSDRIIVWSEATGKRYRFLRRFVQAAADG